MLPRVQRLVYRLAISVKFLDGVLELAGGVLLWTISPATLGRVTRALTQHELTEDPRDFVATHLVALVRHLTTDVRVFSILFLLVHGLVKVVLVAALWKERLRVFPWAIGVFVLFLLYEGYRVSYSRSIMLATFAGIDLVVIFVVWREYRRRIARGSADH